MPKKKPKKTETILDNLIKALRKAYPNDPTKPGVVVTCLETGEETEYYVAIHRYHSRLGEGRQVKHPTSAPTLRRALVACAKSWTGQTDELASLKDSLR